jgi:hypothetical protein
MKRLFLLALLAGGASLAYRYAVVDAPVRACKRFLEAWGAEETPAAAAMTEGESAKASVETHILRGVCQAPMEALRGSRCSVESRAKGPGGQEILTMHQVVAFDPPGVTTGIGGAMAASFRHVVTMRKTAAGWKVSAFEPTYLDAVETRRR